MFLKPSCYLSLQSDVLYPDCSPALQLNINVKYDLPVLDRIIFLSRAARLFNEKFQEKNANFNVFSKQINSGSKYTELWAEFKTLYQQCFEHEVRLLFYL